MAVWSVRHRCCWRRRRRCLNDRSSTRNHWVRSKDVNTKKNYNQFSCYYSSWYNYLMWLCMIFSSMPACSRYIVNIEQKKSENEKLLSILIVNARFVFVPPSRCLIRPIFRRLTLVKKGKIRNRITRNKRIAWKMKCRAVYRNSRFRVD